MRVCRDKQGGAEGRKNEGDMEGRREERSGVVVTRLVSTAPADATRAATPADLGRVFSACRYDGWAGRSTRAGWANDKSNFDVVYLVVGHNFSISRARGGICHGMKVVTNAMVLPLGGATNVDVLFVYPGGNCLVEGVSS